MIDTSNAIAFIGIMHALYVDNMCMCSPSDKQTNRRTNKRNKKYNNLGRGDNAFFIVLNPLVNSHGLAYFPKASNNLSNVYKGGPIYKLHLVL